MVPIENRSTEMPAIISGNSKMLACFREDGKLYKLFWPHIDYGENIGLFLSGINIMHEPVNTLWLGEGTRQNGQYYLDNTNIITTHMTTTHFNLEVTQTDLVLPDDDVLVRNYRIRNNDDRTLELTFLTYTLFEIEESNHYDTAYFDYDIPSLVHFRRNAFFALAADHNTKLSGYQCGRKNSPVDPLINANNGILTGYPNGIREAAGALSWRLGILAQGEEKEITLYLAAAHTRNDVAKLINEVRSRDFLYWLKYTQDFWEGMLASGKSIDLTQDNSYLYNRSLLTVKLLCDKQTGGIIAAPEFDPHYSACGGYGYCWGRDGAIIAAAMDEAGLHETARSYYMYAVRTQEPDGTWHQRHYMDGVWASSWGKQLDQGAGILWGYGHHYRLTSDSDFLEIIWTSTVLAAEYLAHHLSEDNGLPEHTVDLWEEELSQNTYTAASVCAGLMAAASLALAKNENALATKWQAASDRVKLGILNYQWSPQLNRFYRSVNPEVTFEHYQNSLQHGLKAKASTDMLGLYPKYFAGVNDRVDASILGLSFPYQLLDPNDPRILASAQAVEEHLTNRNIGGIHRYQWDNYAGGNPWIITTLWLALCYCQSGNMNRARELYNWCAAHTNPNGLLPEQVDRDNGQPAWVLPLTWSHAMFIFTHLALQGKLSICKQTESTTSSLRGGGLRENS